MAVAWQGIKNLKPDSEQSRQNSGQNAYVYQAYNGHDPIDYMIPFEAMPGGSYGALGLNTELYFSKPLSTPIDRIDRLEKYIVALQQDMARIAPLIQTLATQDEMAANRNASLPAGMQPHPSSKPVSLTPAMQNVLQDLGTKTSTAKPQPVSTKRPAVTGPAKITRLRLGEHSNRTRIVLDATGPVQYKYDLDNMENLLLVEMPTTPWAGQKEWTTSSSDLISSYTVQPIAGGSGSRLVIQLKKPTVVLSSEKIPANGTLPDRIFFDLKK